MNNWVIAMVTAVAGFVFGYHLGYNNHPYQQCARQYVGEENMGECVWLKLHGAN